VIVYGGHGAYFPDESGDEEDTRNQALVPVDYQQTDLFISDDELWDVRQAGPEGAGVTAIMDCCHSMSNSRVRFRFGAALGNINIREIKPDRRQIEAHRTRTARVRSGQLKPIEAMRHIKFTTCRDNEYALEVDGQGGARNGSLAVSVRRRAMPHHLLAFVDLKAGQFEMLHDPLGKLLAGIIGYVILRESVRTSPNRAARQQ
jgi:Caspase domain